MSKRDMTFNDVFNFLVKRFNEIGFKETDALLRFANELRVKHHHVNSLESGLIINPEYKSYGFKE
jgi:hypothetical protein